jgi:hypothetical protein
MAKLILFSVLIALVALPIRAARERDVRRGLKKALVMLVAFNLAYAFAVLLILPRLS